jgi:hypothetical protein
MNAFASLVDPISALERVNIMRAARKRAVDVLPPRSAPAPKPLRVVKHRKYKEYFDIPLAATIEIPSELFDRVQAVAYKHKHSSPKRYKFKWLNNSPISYMTRVA